MCKAVHFSQSDTPAVWAGCWVEIPLFYTANFSSSFPMTSLLMGYKATLYISSLTIPCITGFLIYSNESFGYEWIPIRWCLFSGVASKSHTTLNVWFKRKQKVILTPHLLLKNIFAILLAQLTHKAVLSTQTTHLFCWQFSFRYLLLTFTYIAFSENTPSSTPSESVVVV